MAKGRIAAEMRSTGPLTHREGEVLKEICEGRGQKEVARRLGISPKTVSIHVDHILEKLGVHSMLQAVLAAIADGMVTVHRVANIMIIFTLLSGTFEDNAYRQRHPRHRGGHIRVSQTHVRGNGRKV